MLDKTGEKKHLTGVEIVIPVKKILKVQFSDKLLG